MKFNLMFMKRMVPFMLILSLLYLLSCEQETPVTPMENNTSSNVIILKADPSLRSDLNKLFTVKKWIDDDGGYIMAGDEECGYSYLKFPEDAVYNDVLIEMNWQSEELLQADFFPEGLTFNKPVYIRLSYKDALMNMLAVDSQLGLYYYNEENGYWELISNNVNHSEKYVEGYINHFSRYAIGIE